jgi:hypothetical protein
MNMYCPQAIQLYTVPHVVITRDLLPSLWGLS